MAGCRACQVREYIVSAKEGPCKMSMSCPNDVIDARLDKTRILVNIDDVPRHVVTKNSGFVVVKTAMPTEIMKKLPFLANEEFRSLEEALEEAHGGAYHRVSWSYDDGPFKAVFKDGFKIGTWLATTYGITARRWENESTGGSGVSFKLLGVMPKQFDEDCVDVDVDAILATASKGDDADAAEAEA